jgi:hypothetical protein
LNKAIYFWTHYDRQFATTCFWKIEDLFDTKKFNKTKEALQLSEKNIETNTAGPLGLIYFYTLEGQFFSILPANVGTELSGASVSHKIKKFTYPKDISTFKKNNPDGTF